MAADFARFDLKELLAEAAQDEAREKGAHQLASQDDIARLLKTAQTPPPTPPPHEPP